MQTTQSKKFLEFNGKNVYFISKDGTWWIAIKPICEALGVDYEQQRKNLKTDKLLDGAPCNHTVHDSSGRLQKMVCLPEFFIYGWIFKIQSKSQRFLEYQWKCYELLYNHFHGTLTGRSAFLKEKTLAEIEIEKLEKQLLETPEFKRLSELKAKIKQANKASQRLDKLHIAEQMELWTAG